MVSLEAHTEPLVPLRTMAMSMKGTRPSHHWICCSYLPIRLNLLKFLLHTVYIFICILTAFMLQKIDENLLLCLWISLFLFFSRSFQFQGCKDVKAYVLESMQFGKICLSGVLARVSSVVKRYREHSHSYKGKH